MIKSVKFDQHYNFNTCRNPLPYKYTHWLCLSLPVVHSRWLLLSGDTAADPSHSQEFLAGRPCRSCDQLQTRLTESPTRSSVHTLTDSLDETKPLSPSRCTNNTNVSQWLTYGFNYKMLIKCLFKSNQTFALQQHNYFSHHCHISQCPMSPSLKLQTLSHCRFLQQLRKMAKKSQYVQKQMTSMLLA